MSWNNLDKCYKTAFLFSLLYSYCYGTVFIAHPYAIRYNRQDSPLQCGPDQYLDNCASPCPLTCENITNPPYCPAVCVQGCTCINRRHVYDNNSGRCVPPEYCAVVPNRCRHNQTYYTTNFNGATCDGVTIVYGKPGCYCGERFVLNRLNGQCVLPKDCPKYPADQVCPNNEYVNSCKNPCEPTCRDPSDRICPTFQCIYGCSCRKGLVRDETTGKCVEQRLCSTPPVKPRCPQNEEFKSCGTQCEPTCDWPQVTCSLPCVRGCFCKRGYIRVSQYGECVPEWVCAYVR